MSTAQNGPGTAAVIDQVFDAVGREIWSRDAEGFLRHTQYDAQTGAVVKSIVDVDTTCTADFDVQSLPSGWATPTGGGLHLVPTHERDPLGRITKATDPNVNITFTVYDDVNHATRTYAGWNASTKRPTGPITVSRRDLSGTYTESLTYSAVPAVDAQGRPTGTESITNLQSLTRSVMNAAGQVIAVDRYTNLAGLPYSTASATLGAEGVNYLRTRYAYNNQGQVDRLQNPAGTTHTYAYDVTGRQTADAITTLGTGVSGTVRRIEPSYDVLGRITSVTSFDAPASGTAVNQVTRGYNGFGQLTSEWQSHTGLVNTSTTPRVQYAYSQGSGGNHSRLTRITYPDGYQVNYTYSGIDSAVSRPTSLTGLRTNATTAVTLEAFKYRSIRDLHG
ncbi:MAG: hypothetical protein ACKOOF_04840 [Planctomycetaceae bacterium]